VRGEFICGKPALWRMSCAERVSGGNNKRSIFRLYVDIPSLAMVRLLTTRACFSEDYRPGEERAIKLRNLDKPDGHMGHEPNVVGRPIKDVSFTMHFTSSDFQHDRASPALAYLAGSPSVR